MPYSYFELLECCIVEKTGRGGTYLWVIVTELRAAKHEAFSRPQGESVLHILLQVGVVAGSFHVKSTQKILTLIEINLMTYNLHHL